MVSGAGDKQAKGKYDSLDPITEIKEPCKNCGQPIEVIAYRGTGACGINCHKILFPEPPKPRY